MQIYPFSKNQAGGQVTYTSGQENDDVDYRQ